VGDFWPREACSSAVINNLLTFTVIGAGFFAAGSMSSNKSEFIQSGCGFLRAHVKRRSRRKFFEENSQPVSSSSKVIAG
jgi:hypothetical protein